MRDDRILVRSHYVQLYPFTVYHGAEKDRRYTLYANSESARQKWHEKLVDAIGVNQARGEANMVGYLKAAPVDLR
jgi:RHO1 GDP-GTP exchange protein 1/2